MRAAARALPAVLVAMAGAACGEKPGDSDARSPVPSPTADPGERAPWPTPTPMETALTLSRRLPHDGWSEGLDIHGGELWHAFPGSIDVLDTATGELLREYEPPSTYSESLAWRDGVLWNVSYHDSNVYAGTLGTDGVSLTFRIAGTTPDVHAWGITADTTHIVVTGNGKPTLYFLDPQTLELEHQVDTPVDDLEDLAFDRGAIWASSYSEYNGQFFRIEPSTGAILDVHPLPDPAECEIVDGIAVSEDELYVTGKDCPWIYVYALPYGDDSGSDHVESETSSLPGSTSLTAPMPSTNQ